MKEMNEGKICQSCAMPIDDVATRGTEKDGSKSEEYCSYCYEGGAFTYESTMQEMIEACVPHMVGEQFTEQSARQMMEQVFPTLKRWAQ